MHFQASRISKIFRGKPNGPLTAGRDRTPPGHPQVGLWPPMVALRPLLGHSERGLDSAPSPSSSTTIIRSLLEDNNVSGVMEHLEDNDMSSEMIGH